MAGSLRSWMALGAACWAAVAACSAALAADKVALVIGNSRYAAAPSLANPANDAADVGAALREIGFQVVEQRDASRTAMADAVRDFVARLDGARTALLYYAGHGIQVNGENFLLPVDASIKRPADVRFGTLNLSDIMAEMEGKARTTVIVLDACRENPFAAALAASGTRSVSTTRGLGKVDTTGAGTLVVYSTQPNAVAFDGKGRNSPFTTALLKHLRAPGLEVRQMLSRVRGDVMEATDKRQVPWDNSSLTGDVFLAGSPPAPPAVTAAVPASASPQPGPLVDAATAELLFWQSAAKVDTEEVYASYLQRYGETGQFSVLARSRVAALRRPAETPASAPGAPAAPRAAEGAARAAAPRTECDRLAEVDLDLIDSAKALPACHAAANEHPLEPRFIYNLGRIHDGAKSYAEASKLYARAALLGADKAYAALAALHIYGQGVPKDNARAFQLYSAGVERNDPSALTGLGGMYADGKHVKRDPAKAMELFNRSLALGNDRALTNIAILHWNGQGVPRNPKLAINYLEQTGAQGHVFAMKMLADIYLYGQGGVPRDVAKAREWSARARRT